MPLYKIWNRKTGEFLGWSEEVDELGALIDLNLRGVVTGNLGEISDYLFVADNIFDGHQPKKEKCGCGK